MLQRWFIHEHKKFSFQMAHKYWVESIGVRSAIGYRRWQNLLFPVVFDIILPVRIGFLELIWLRLITDELSGVRCTGLVCLGECCCRRFDIGLVRLVGGWECLDVWGLTLSDRPMSFLMASGDSAPNEAKDIYHMQY